MCRQREKSAGKSNPSSSRGKSSGTQTCDIIVDWSVIDDLIALVETRVAVSVASVDI